MLIRVLAPATIANSSPAFTRRPAAPFPIANLSTIANLRYQMRHPRRDGGASGYARAPTYATARPAAQDSLKLQLAPAEPL